MFCYQCEQTAHHTGCTAGGVCGKTSEAARAQDELTGALIGLARAAKGREAHIADRTDALVARALFATLTNVNFDPEELRSLTGCVRSEKHRLGDAEDYDLSRLWDEPTDIRSLKSLVLFGLRGLAAYVHHANVLGYSSQNTGLFFYRALRRIGCSQADEKSLLALALEVGKFGFDALAMLDRANTETYGDPVPTSVSLTIRKGPFIVVSGHDLRDLELLLQQTEGQGVDVYTHGEMLPAHGYPKLRRYAQLKGNFGTAWQNQQREFENVPGAFLFTTNCLMPPRDSYRANVFTTGVVAFPGLRHIGSEKNFAPVIARAKELGGYAEDQVRTGLNGGRTVTTGCGRAALLAVTRKILDAVKAGAVKRLYLVGGCDGARSSRSSYTELVKALPADTIVLTLGCCKYRFNDLDLGTVAGIPRLLDMGQCNDAYGAIQVALALAKELGCGVNDLPLTLVLSWYEQKAVLVLLTLLHLGIKDIRLGPTLPAFLSPAVLKELSASYGVKSIEAIEKFHDCAWHNHGI